MFKPDSYAVQLAVMVGSMICKPVEFRNYTSAKGLWHVCGILSGAIWCSGLVLNLVGSRAALVGPAVSYAIGQGATMISAALGGLYLARVPRCA
jgi:glucose uptake protein GlcU